MSTDKFTLIADSTQLQAFSECPEMWQLGYREHLIREGADSKEAMHAGTYGHSMLDIYYKSRAAGSSLDDAVDLSVSYEPDTKTCTCGHDEEAHEQTEPDGICFIGDCKKCACKDLQWQPFPLSQDLRYLVRARFRDHVFKYRNNDIQPHSPESVEVGFSEPIYEDGSNLFVLEGRFDVLGSIQGINLVMDHKFQMRRRDLYKKSIQFRNYNLISGYQTFMINYIRLTKKVDETTYVRDAISFQPAETRWWKQQLIGMFFDIKMALLTAETLPCNGYNQIRLTQNWGACSGKFGYPCTYTDICEHTDPGLVQIIKDTRYTKREAWSPWD